MYLKVHKTPMGDVVAVCDRELVGNVYSDSRRRLDLAAHSKFYVGELVSHKQAVVALQGATNINLVGKKAIRAAKAAGLGVKSAITIGEVPHLQAYQVV